MEHRGGVWSKDQGQRVKQEMHSWVVTRITSMLRNIRRKSWAMVIPHHGKPVSAQNPANVMENTSLQVLLSHKWPFTPLCRVKRLDFPSALASQSLLQRVEGCGGRVEMLLCTNYSRVTIFSQKVSIILTNVGRKKKTPSPSLIAPSSSHTMIRYASH